MELTKKCLSLIEGNSKIRNLIAAALGVTESSVRRWLDGKSNHEMLTTASALKVIREETGLTDDQILMESETVKK